MSHIPAPLRRLAHLLHRDALRRGVAGMAMGAWLAGAVWAQASAVPAPRSPACRDALAALQADENRLLQEQRGRGTPAGAPPARERLRPARERAARACLASPAPGAEVPAGRLAQPPATDRKSVV